MYTLFSQIMKRRISNMSIESGKSYVLTSEKPIGQKVDQRVKQIETENKYYLDFGPAAALPSLPPLPPPNIPTYFDVTSTSTNDNIVENYYCAINDKKI